MIEISKKIKIIGYASEICWWMGCLGKTYPVIAINEKTGFLRIEVTRTEFGFESEPFVVKGWIEPLYVEEVLEEG